MHEYSAYNKFTGAQSLNSRNMFIVSYTSVAYDTLMGSQV